MKKRELSDSPFNYGIDSSHLLLGGNRIKGQTMPEKNSQASVPYVPDKNAHPSAGAVWVMHCRYIPVHPFIIITGGPSFFGV